jgi:putative oxidoreductase
VKPVYAILFGGSASTSWMGETALGALRIFSGLALALAHGWGKLPVSADFVQFVARMGFPLPVLFAWSAALSEFVGGLLLAAGLCTRPAAFFVAVTMSVAAFIVHADDPFVRKEPALLFLMVALTFLFYGAGRVSVDALIRRLARLGR